jgi:hypothetical protein
MGCTQQKFIVARLVLPGGLDRIKWFFSGCLKRRSWQAFALAAVVGRTK